MSIFPNTTIYWENNHATLGGAICVDDEISSQIARHSIITKKEIHCAISITGHGAIDNCTLSGRDLYSSGEVFMLDIILKMTTWPMQEYTLTNFTYTRAVARIFFARGVTYALALNMMCMYARITTQD